MLRRVVLEEKVALEQQLAEEKHTPESCFIEAAIQEVKVSTWELQTCFP